MNPLATDESRAQERSSTSAGGAMRGVRPVTRIIVLGSRFEPGTVARVLDPDVWEQLELESQHTNSGCASEGKEEPRDTGAAIHELRRLTGLTWNQLGRLFRVARRSLHYWASGKPLNAGHEEHLYRMLDAARAIDRGNASENRTLLLREHQGLVPFDLLADGHYDAVVALVGAGPGRTRGMPPLSPAEQAARTPLSPELLADALQDTVHRDVGRGRAARTVKVKRRGRQ